MASVQTVTGTCALEDLGRTLVHEHLLVGYPGWQMDALAPRFDRREAYRRAVDMLVQVREQHGLRTLLDPCPMDLGRDVEFMAEVSQASGLQIICTTGAYFEEQGLTYTFRNLPLDDIAAIYEKEITTGVGETEIRAGAIKVATGSHRVSDYERKLLTAAARASVRCSVPIITHTQEGTCGLEQIAILTAAGVPAGRILVGHSDGIDDPAYHRRIVAAGAFIGFDRLGIEVILPDEIRLRNIASLVSDGHGDRICLSHDACIGAWLGRPIFAPETPIDPSQIALLLPNWSPLHLFTRVIPRLRELGVSAAAIIKMTDENPARWFGAARG